MKTPEESTCCYMEEQNYTCGGTKLNIKNALYSFKSHRNLLSFKAIRINGYHIEIRDDRGIEYLCIRKHDLDKICVIEKLPTFSSSLYYTILVQLKYMPL